MVRWLRPLVVAVALAGMIALGGVALGRIFAGPLLAELVAGAAAASVGIGAAARRLPGSAVAPLSVVALAAYTTLALWLSARHAADAAPLAHLARDSLVNGIPRLLTAMIPVEAAPDTVVVPVIAAWLAGLAGAELALRGGRVLAGLAPAVLLYAGALYVVGPNAGAAGWPTLVFAALAVAVLAVSARPAGVLRDVPAETRAAVRGRAVAGAAFGLVGVLALVAAVGPWVAGRVAATPVDPRRYVQPPQVNSLDESPLNRISGWMLSPGQRLLAVGPVTPPLPAKTGKVRLRLAVLPDYDGVTWRVGATYRNAGRVLPAAPRLPGAGVEEVRQSITVEGLTGRLLPVVPAPTGVAGARVAFDAATGTLIRPEGLTAALRYTVTSVVQSPDLNELPSALTPSGDAVARFLAIGPNVPPDIQKLADQLADGNGAPYDRAAAIQDFLAQHYRQVPDAPSGHAYPNLNFFLFGPRGQGGQRGTSEQFAASFALLARLTGLPSRVVVGFDAPAGGGEVTGRDALAWPEVLFDGLGWVAFDPMPKTNDPRPVEEDFIRKPSTPPSEPSPPAVTASTPASAPPSARAAAAGDRLPGVVVASGASGSVLLVLAAAGALIVVSRRSLRRRRLTEGSPDARIAGAWSEFTDALRLAGRPVPPHLAATEAAAYASRPPAPTRGLLRRAVPAVAHRPARRGTPEQPGPGAAGDTAGRAGDTAGRAGNSAAAGRESGTESRTPPAAGVRAAGAENGDAGSGWAAGDGDPAAVRDARTVPAGAGAGERAAAGREAQLPPLDDLVAGINTVGFAPGAADEAQAERAARQAVAYAAALRERRSWWRRIWWSVHPGPLRWDKRN